MAKQLKQSHLRFCLQNRRFKFCPEIHVPPSPKSCSGNRGLRAKGAKGLRIFLVIIFHFIISFYTICNLQYQSLLSGSPVKGGM